MHVFVSVGCRVLVSVEALNAVESVGNVTKHRRAPLVVKSDGKYKLVYVPAVSGESLAHAYQEHLVELAKIVYGKENLAPPLTEWDLRCEFVKFMDNQHLTDSLKAVVEKKDKEAFEKEAITASLVSDIGGFLYAEEALPVKRTSRFQVGYMVPVMDAIESTAIESQMHVRHAPSETGSEAERAAQMIYYVEVASAVYGLSFNLDIDGIGYASLVKRTLAVSEEERLRRIRVALGALATLLTGMAFGAKISRFKPIIDVESLVVALSEPVAFSVSSPLKRDYFAETAKRASKLIEVLGKVGVDQSIKVYQYGFEEGVAVEGVSIECGESLEDVFEALIDDVLAKLGAK